MLSWKVFTTSDIKQVSKRPHSSSHFLKYCGSLSSKRQSFSWNQWSALKGCRKSAKSYSWPKLTKNPKDKILFLVEKCKAKAEVSMYLHTECAHKLLSWEYSAQKFILLLAKVTKYGNSFLLNTEIHFC